MMALAFFSLIYTMPSTWHQSTCKLVIKCVESSALFVILSAVYSSVHECESCKYGRYKKMKKKKNSIIWMEWLVNTSKALSIHCSELKFSPWPLKLNDSYNQKDSKLDFFFLSAVAVAFIHSIIQSVKEWTIWQSNEQYEERASKSRNLGKFKQCQQCQINHFFAHTKIEILQKENCVFFFLNSQLLLRWYVEIKLPFFFFSQFAHWTDLFVHVARALCLWRLFWLWLANCNKKRMKIIICLVIRLMVNMKWRLSWIPNHIKQTTLSLYETWHSTLIIIFDFFFFIHELSFYIFNGQSIKVATPIICCCTHDFFFIRRKPKKNVKRKKIVGPLVVANISFFFFFFWRHITDAL